MNRHEVRDGWQMRRVRTIAKNVDEKTNDADSGSLYIGLENVESWTGRILLPDVPVEPESTVIRFKSGDVLFGKLRPYLAKVLEAQRNGVCSTEFLVLRALNGIDHRFLRYALASPAFIDDVNAWTYGVKMPRANWERFGNLLLAVPRAEQQHAIAEFLDQETAEADALIGEYERLLALLEERRIVLITQVVTKGLDPNVPMKGSGIEWIGEIPENWKLTPLKHVVDGLTVGIVVTPAAYYVSAGVPCLRSLNIGERSISSEDLVYISESSNEYHRKSQIRKGDIVIVRTGRPGTAAVVDDRFDNANCIDLLIARRSESVESAFVAYYLNSKSAQVQCELVSGGALQQHLNVSVAGSIILPVPPKAEQIRIVERLDADGRAHAQMLATARKALSLVQERRSALITAAVTGQIDVTTYKPNITSEVA